MPPTRDEHRNPGGPRKLRSGNSLWSEFAGKSPAYGPLTGDTECEVLVLGAGVTGSLIARRLAKVGVSVALVAEREVGRGSTATSTGLLQYEVDTPLIDLIGKVGEAAAVHAYRRGLVAIDEIEALVTESENAGGFARRDSLYFCSLLTCATWNRNLSVAATSASTCSGSVATDCAPKPPSTRQARFARTGTLRSTRYDLPGRLSKPQPRMEREFSTILKTPHR
jgi:hypothetical protein